MSDASRLDEIVPFEWAERVRYEVICDETFVICKDDTLENGVRDALVALGHGWDVAQGPAGDDRRTLYVRVEADLRTRGSEVKAGFRIALTAITAGLIPLATPSEIEVHVTARRGTQELLARRRIGDGNVTSVFSMNPIMVIKTSPTRTVARAIGADIVVATLYQLTRNQER